MAGRLALVTHNVASMRAEPDGGSEQVSQAILGDIAAWLAERDNYVQVRTADSYEGWIWRGNVRDLGDGLCLAPGIEEFSHVTGGNSLSPVPWPFLAEPLVSSTPDVRYIRGGIVDLYATPNDLHSPITKLVMGTWLRVIDAEAGSSSPMLKVAIPFHMPGIEMRQAEQEDILPPILLSGYVNAADVLSATGYGYRSVFSSSAVCALAQRFIGTPYLWGGTTPFGFDCSGYVQCLYKLHNIVLPRDAYTQAKSALGVVLASGTTPTAGDLVFFCGRSDPRKRGITHVGIALDAERFIHAYGKQGVGITRFDDSACRANYTYVSAWRYQEQNR